MSEHMLPNWIFVPELESLIAQAETIDDFLNNNTILLSVLDYIHEGISILSPDRKILFLNKPIKEWYSAPDTSIGITCSKLFHHTDHFCDNCPAKTCLETGNPASSIVKAHIHDNNGYMHVHVAPIHNSSGEIVLLLEYVRDVSFYKESEESVIDLYQRIEVLEQQNRLLLSSLTMKEQEYHKLEQTIQANIQQYVKPALDYLKRKIDESDYELISKVIEQSVYPINANKIPKMPGLTPREIQIVRLIKKGLSSKEIATQLYLSKKAIDYHRASLRKKFKLSQNTSLQSFIESNF